MTARAGHGPLVAFTSLAIAGAGLLAASACFELAGHPRPPHAAAMGGALLAAGLAVSLGHLGQRRRARLAVRGTGRSALSNEALLAGLAAGAAFAAAALDPRGAPAAAATMIAGAMSAAFLVSVGLVYRVGGQRTWRSFSAVTPLSGGLAFGAIAVQSVTGDGGVLPGTLGLVAADALVFSRRWRQVAGITLSEAVLGNPWMLRRTQLLAARFFLLDALPYLLLAASATPMAVVVAAAGLLVDRFGFYALAVQHTTEHEIANVEDRIAAPDHGPLE